MSPQDIVESWIEKWREEGLSEGRKEGRQEGRKEGRGDGLVEALLTLYEARLGTPPPEVVGAIRQTQDLAVLRSWLKPIGMGSADDVAAALRAAKSCE